MEFSNLEGIVIVNNIIKAIQSNKGYLSEIDGAIGDGDHGINMNKGFSLAQEQITDSNTMSEGLQIISNVLMNKIGGSMGPLYGNFFRGMYKASCEEKIINDQVIIAMLDTGHKNICSISNAKRNDKTLIDVLEPALNALHQEYEKSKDMEVALEKMIIAANEGCDATKNMVARLGRASRLGERSLGHVDAGATSTKIILEALVKGIHQIV